MRILLMLVIGLALAGGLYYFMLSNNTGMQTKVNSQTNEAQVKADAYKKNQADMMKQLGQ